MAICYVDDTSLRRKARPVMHWLLVNAYVFLVCYVSALSVFSESVANEMICSCCAVLQATHAIRTAVIDVNLSRIVRTSWPSWSRWISERASWLVRPPKNQCAMRYVSDCCLLRNWTELVRSDAVDANALAHLPLAAVAALCSAALRQVNVK